MYEDFIERRFGAAKELEEWLNRNPTDTPDSGHCRAASSSFIQRSPAPDSASYGQQPSGGVAPLQFSSQTYDPQPHHRNGISTVIECDPESRWLLACARGKNRPISLSQLDVCSISSDKELFREIRKAYTSYRSTWTLSSSLRTVQSIRFVQV